MRTPLLTAMVLSLVVLATACSDKKKWAERHQAAQEQAKSDLKSKDSSPTATAASAKPADPFWDDPSLTKVYQESACPEGLWALFKGTPPGNDAAARKANEAKRAEYVKALRGKRFVTRIHSPSDVKFADYDMRKAELPLEIKGVIDCTDSGGHIALAFGDARAVVPPTSVMQEGAVVTQNIWASAPITFTLPIKTMGEANEFLSKHKFDVDARIVFKLGTTDVDRKLFKQPKVTEGEISMGGGTEDWGAGRLVRTEIEAIRIATDRESTVLLDTREKTAAAK